MFEVRQTNEFGDWLDRLRDRRSAALIARRILRLEAGLFGDSKSVGGGVSELRIDTGPGYRVYFTRRGNALILLLLGGDKGSKGRDVRAAQAMVAQLEWPEE